MEDAPAVTALVTAYGSCPHLGAALGSVAAQTLAPTDYETVLVTNLPEERIPWPRPTEGARRRVVRSGEAAKGRFFADGLRGCRAPIVAFLNDDDLWAPSKLERVLEVFRTNPSIGFYHHGVRYIDAQGQPTNPRRGLAPRAASDATGRLILPPYPRSLGTLGLGFNDSAIAIDRRLALGSIDLLEQIDASEDTFLFYTALSASAGLFADDRPLTDYRSYGASSSAGGSGPPEERARRLRREFAKRLETYGVIERMVARGGTTGVRRAIRRELSLYRLLVELLGGSDRRAIARSVADLLREWSVMNPSMNLAIANLAAVGVVSPALSRRLLATIASP